MHIKCLENPVNVLKRPNEPRKIPILNTTLLLFYVDTRNFLKAIRGNGYRPVPKGGMFPIGTIMLVVRSLYPNLPQMGQNFHHGMSLHDSMPSFMNFRQVLDLQEFKNQVSQSFASNQHCPGVWNSFPVSCMGPKHAPKDTHVIFQPIYMHWSLCM